MTEKINVAIFARVSSKTDRQSNSRQVNELKEICKTKGWVVIKVITEKESGGKTKKDRPKLTDLLRLATTNEIQKVVVSELTRLGRKIGDVRNTIDELAKSRVSLYIQNMGMESLNDLGELNPSTDFMLNLIASFAEYERKSTQERIKQGLKEARRKGIKLGRPKGKEDVSPIDKYPKVAKELLRKDPLPIRKMAAAFGVSTTTIQKVKKALKDSGQL